MMKMETSKIIHRVGLYGFGIITHGLLKENIRYYITNKLIIYKQNDNSTNSNNILQLGSVKCLKII